jgi:hypothetical protein
MSKINNYTCEIVEFPSEGGVVRETKHSANAIIGCSLKIHLCAYTTDTQTQVDPISVMIGILPQDLSDTGNWASHNNLNRVIDQFLVLVHQNIRKEN